MRRIGVLALQGAFDAHRRVLSGLGVEAPLVRSTRDLEGLDAIVLPGGESTTMLRFLARDGLFEALGEFVAARPALGTCAGLILLAREVEPHQPSLGALDLTVARNAYGRQRDSKVLRGETRLPGGPFEMVFIRAPRITLLGAGVEVLARRGDDPVLVRQGNAIGCAFHPELGGDDRVHRLLIEGCESN